MPRHTFPCITDDCPGELRPVAFRETAEDAALRGSRHPAWKRLGDIWYCATCDDLHFIEGGPVSVQMVDAALKKHLGKVRR